MKTIKDFTILIAEDDESLRKSIEFDLKRKGFTIFTAENGLQAFEVVRREKIDLVVSDIRMPGGDGIMLLEKIRAEHPHIPALIFMTGFSDVSEKECLEKGAKMVLAKPFDRKILFASIVETLGIVMAPALS